MKTDTPETPLCDEFELLPMPFMNGKAPSQIRAIGWEQKAREIESALTAQLTACRSALHEARDYVIDYGNEKTMAPVIERIDAALDGQSVKEAQL